MKVTHQRTEIFRELAGTEAHPDAETVYQRVSRRVPAVSRDTVYRSLSAFETMGLIRRTEILCDRARYDANTAPHHHYVCTRCGAVHDFLSDALEDLPVPRAVKSMGTVVSAHLQLRGICSACARQGRARTWAK